MTSSEIVNIVNDMKKKDIILGVRVDTDLEEQIRSLAKKEDRSVSWILRHLILKGLKTKGILEQKSQRSNRR